MSLQTIDGVQGDWGPELWPDASATVQANGSQVQANGILTQSTTAQGQDPWTGWLQNVAGSAINVWTAAKAKASGLAPAVTPTGVPTYVPTTPSVARPGVVITPGMVLFGAAVAGAYLLAKAGK